MNKREIELEKVDMEKMENIINSIKDEVPIPYELFRDKKIKARTKIFYTIISGIPTKNGYLDLTNLELTFILNKSKKTIQNCIRDLNGKYLWTIYIKGGNQNNRRKIFFNHNEYIAALNNIKERQNYE